MYVLLLNISVSLYVKSVRVSDRNELIRKGISQNVSFPGLKLKSKFQRDNIFLRNQSFGFGKCLFFWENYIIVVFQGRIKNAVFPSNMHVFFFRTLYSLFLGALGCLVNAMLPSGHNMYTDFISLQGSRERDFKGKIFFYSNLRGLKRRNMIPNSQTKNWDAQKPPPN